MVLDLILVGAAGYAGRKAYKKYKSHKNLKAAAASQPAPPPYSREPPQSYYQEPVPPMPKYIETAPIPPKMIEDTKPSLVPSVQEPPQSDLKKDIIASVQTIEKPPPMLDREWRPVYMLERSTSKNNFNKVRTHRALYVGELEGADQSSGRAYEIRKVKPSSLLGMFGSREMIFTDAEQWIGPKAVDRAAVFLGYTNWTDEELNREGHAMVDDYPAYSLDYSNCQHFVADLAEKIIPDDQLVRGGRALTEPNFDKLLYDLEHGNITSHGGRFVKDVADLGLGVAKLTNKFFHFYKAAFQSVVKLNWKPYDQYGKFIMAERQRRQVMGAERERERRKLMAESQASLSTQSTGASTSSTTSLPRTNTGSTTSLPRPFPVPGR